VKTSLLDDYEKFFATLTDTPSERAVASLELIHYSETLRDTQLIDVGAYRTNKEPHVYSLLRRLVAVSKDVGFGIYL
jgi:hypothetical protein